MVPACAATLKQAGHTRSPPRAVFVEQLTARCPRCTRTFPLPADAACRPIPPGALVDSNSHPGPVTTSALRFGPGRRAVHASGEHQSGKVVEQPGQRRRISGGKVVGARRVSADSAATHRTAVILPQRAHWPAHQRVERPRSVYRAQQSPTLTTVTSSARVRLRQCGLCVDPSTRRGRGVAAAGFGVTAARAAASRRGRLTGALV
jgi:hypothetical protein